MPKDKNTILSEIGTKLIIPFHVLSNSMRHIEHGPEQCVVYKNTYILYYIIFCAKSFYVENHTFFTRCTCTCTCTLYMEFKRLYYTHRPVYRVLGNSCWRGTCTVMWMRAAEHKIHCTCTCSLRVVFGGSLEGDPASRALLWIYRIFHSVWILPWLPVDP